jgi:hypothetical protein
MSKNTTIEELRAGDVVLSTRERHWVDSNMCLNDISVVSSVGIKRGIANCSKTTNIYKFLSLNSLKNWEIVGDTEEVYDTYNSRIELAKKLSNLSLWKQTYHGDRHVNKSELTCIDFTDKEQAVKLQRELSLIKTELKKVCNYIQEHYYALYVGTLREWVTDSTLTESNLAGKLLAKDVKEQGAKNLAGTILNIKTAGSILANESSTVIGCVTSVTSKSINLTLTNGLEASLSIGYSWVLTIDGVKMRYARVYVAGEGSLTDALKYEQALEKTREDITKATALYSEYFLNEDSMLGHIIARYFKFRLTREGYTASSWINEEGSSADLQTVHKDTAITDILAESRTAVDTLMGELKRLRAEADEADQLIQEVYQLSDI